MSAVELRRYSNLPALLYLLQEKRLTLLDPASWDDSNDSYYLALYKEKRKLKAVLALCFAQSPETYHHWKIFAAGSSGVCIEFDRELLLETLEQQPQVRIEPVKYLTIDQVKNGRHLATNDLPFRKRYAFQPESELRIIYDSIEEFRASLDIPISLRCIRTVILSPWMPKPLADSVRVTLRAIGGCTALKIHRSTLVGNDQWKRFGREAR